MIEDKDLIPALHEHFTLSEIMQYINERNRAISSERESRKTMRDHFAGLAMQALIMKNDHIRDDEEISNEAF
jgi:hypothetical protein